MSNSTSVRFDIARGVDVLRGSKLVEHFDGPLAYERAKLCAAEGRGRYLRYWAAKEKVILQKERK